MTPRQTLKQLLKRNQLLVAPGCFDGLSARLVQEAGFEAAYLSGGAVARSMGIPDIGLVTMSETIERAAQVVSAINIPIIADADTGYGNAVNLVRTRARVRAHRRRRDPYRRPDHAQALRPLGRQRSDFLGGDGIETASRAGGPQRPRLLHHRPHRRARRQRLRRRDQTRPTPSPSSASTPSFVEAPQSEEELAEIPRRVPNIPLLVNVFKGGKTPMLPMERLEKMGYRIAIYPSETQRAAIHAMRTALSTLKREGTTESIDATLTTFKDRDKVVGLDDWQQDRTGIYGGRNGEGLSDQRIPV